MVVLVITGLAALYGQGSDLSNSGAVRTPQNGNYPGSGSSITNRVTATSGPDLSNSGAIRTPPNGNYPGSGSSITNAVPSTPTTPAGGTGGVTNTPPSGVTPGSGTSPQPAPTH